MNLLIKRRYELKKKFYDRAVKYLNDYARWLYENGVKKVYVFGSLLKEDFFTETSDVDIYVEGLRKDKNLEALKKAEEIFGDIKFDIIFDTDVVRKEVLEKIKKEGKLWKP